MNFKLDENLPLEIADAFREAGHEIDSVQSEGLTGASDLIILPQIQIQILLTMDSGHSFVSSVALPRDRSIPSLDFRSRRGLPICSTGLA